MRARLLALWRRVAQVLSIMCVTRAAIAAVYDHEKWATRTLGAGIGIALYVYAVDLLLEVLRKAKAGREHVLPAGLRAELTCRACGRLIFSRPVLGAHRPTNHEAIGMMAAEAMNTHWMSRPACSWRRDSELVFVPPRPC